MLDTILNVGLNDTSVEGLSSATDNERFAWDSYRRLIQMFGNVVHGVKGERFEDALGKARDDAGVESDAELPVEALRGLVEEFKGFYEFPEDPQDQLRQAIRAVFDSWTGERAVSLPPDQPHSGRLGHRGQRPADGVRQQGRELRARASRSAATR